MSSTDVILRHRPFGLDHPGTLKSVDVTLDSVQSRRMLLDRWPEEEIGETVNETIHGVMDAQIIDRDTEQSVNAYVQFANGDFLSLAISSSYQDENGAFQFEETHLTFDLNTGETVTLGEVLHTPKDEAALLVEEVLLNRAAEGAFKGFYLSDQGVWLITDAGQELLSHGQIATAGYPIDHLLRD